ncbi:MAG: OmpA family protein [Limnochordia bacterium]|jgi:outer membrane protein OmpA-like peptidoglycan-associated protein
MRHKQVDPFTANPFIVLADVVIILLLMMVLMVLVVGTTSTDMMQRTALVRVQNEVRDSLGAPASEKAGSVTAAGDILTQAFAEQRLRLTWTDGDLQRFWFDGRHLFSKNSNRILAGPNGRDLLVEFGKVLKQHSKLLPFADPRLSSAYKYILVEGHAGKDEANPYDLSYRRAKAVADLWINEAGLDPRVVKIMARGAADSCDYSFSLPPNEQAALCRQLDPRVEIVVVYSAANASKKYLIPMGNQ